MPVRVNIKGGGVAHGHRDLYGHLARCEHCPEMGWLGHRFESQKKLEDLQLFKAAILKFGIIEDCRHSKV